MDDQQLDHPNRPESGEPAGNAELIDQARSEARRHFLKGAVLASPLLLSFASRPVLGGVRYCSPSGFLSGNLSRPQDGGCGGLSPGYWKNHASPGDPWPSPYASGTMTGTGQGRSFSGGTRFHDVFVKGKYNYNDKSMLRVLWQAPGSFAFHTIACLLNAASGIEGYLLAPGQVIQIWNDIMTQGYYLTSTGQQMFEADAKAFFEQTYH